MDCEIHVTITFTKKLIFLFHFILFYFYFIYFIIISFATERYKSMEKIYNYKYYLTRRRALKTGPKFNPSATLPFVLASIPVLLKFGLLQNPGLQGQVIFQFLEQFALKA